MNDDTQTTPQQDGEELLTIDEAGKFLDTSKSTIYRLLGQGDLKGTKVGKQWRFRKSDLTAYLERGPEAISMDAAARAELDALAASIGDSAPDLERASEDAKVIRVAHHIIQEAVRVGASDIHIEPGQSVLRVRFRIDGVLTEAMSIPKSLQETLTARFKIMTDLNIMEKRAPQDGRMPVRTDGKDYEVRISCLPTYYGESIVMRILDRSSVLIGVDNLGFSESEQRTIDRWLHRPSGIVIATGPTGSGKTTNIYSMLSKIDASQLKVLTIEDPVEYLLPDVMQSQVNKRAGLTFAAALRSFLRQDPDVVMIGEIRDVECAYISIEAALTGHLLFTSLHTEDAPQALLRLVDMGIERYLVTATVAGVLATRLCRRLCPACKEPAAPIVPADSSAFAATLGKVRLLSQQGGYSIPNDAIFFEAVGCDECRGTGYRGRVALHEVLDCDPRFTARLLQCATADEMTRLAVDSGMRTLLADGMSKAVAGDTSIDEVLRATGTWI